MPPKAKKANAPKTLSSTVIAAASVAAVVLSFGAYKLAQPAEQYGAMSILDDYFAAKGYGSYGKATSVVFRRGGPSADRLNRHDVKVKLNKKISAGSEPLFSVPRSEIIDLHLIRESEAATLLLYDNSSHVRALGDVSFQTVFYFSFFFMYERRRGKDSNFYPWFQSLPQSFEAEGGALYWPESVGNCLDRMTQPEFVSLQSVVGTTAQGANACCELPEDAILGKAPCEAIVQKKATPFTEEEAKWALSVYLRYNYNEQVFLPGLNFFRRSNAREGVYAQQSRSSQSIDILSPRPLKEGEEPVWNHPRGPGSALAIFGTFEEGSQTIDLPYRLPSAKPKSLVRRMCHDQHNQLIFHANGRPRDAVIECFGALMATTKEQKKHILNLRTREPIFYVDVLGNLTVLAHRHAMSIVNGTQNDKCSVEGLAEEHRSAVVGYMRYASTMFNAITKYLFEETNRHAVAAGLPPRFGEEADAGQGPEAAHVPETDDWSDSEVSP